MRKAFIALFMTFIFMLFFTARLIPLESTTDLKDYFVQNFIEETGAFNSVTAIYLDYRVFDTLFESLLLLVSVIGIIYFSRHKGAL